MNEIKNLLHNLVVFGFGFCLASTLCLVSYSYWEAVRPKDPMIINLDMSNLIKLQNPLSRPPGLRELTNAKLYSSK